MSHRVPGGGSAGRSLRPRSTGTKTRGPLGPRVAVVLALGLQATAADAMGAESHPTGARATPVAVAEATLPRPAPGATLQTAAGTLTGRVVEAGSGRPVSGAAVRIVGADHPAAVTDAAGRFAMEGTATPATEIEVTALGFATERAIWPDAVPDGGFVVRLTPNPVSLDALVVTAGRRVQRLGDAPAPVELLTRREIRETGSVDLASVLTEETGVELQGGHPAGAGLMIQGLGSERVLLLLDGQPFIGRIAGTVDASRIPTSIIERVEIVKGPQSTLYGSEAMGGVVNVVTRSPEQGDLSLAGSVTAGGQGRLDVGVDVVGGVGPVMGLADVGRRLVELAPGRPDEEGARSLRWDAMAKLHARTPVDGLTVDGALVVLDEQQRFRTGQLYSFASNRQWSANVTANLARSGHRLAPTLYATTFDHTARRGTSATPPAGDGELERQAMVEGEVLYGYEADGWSVDGGVEGRIESIRSDRVLGRDLDLDAVEVFAQGAVDLGPFRLVPGVRSSWNERWGRHLTPRAAALARLGERVTVRGSVGRGFRAPAFKELYLSFLNVGPGFGYTVRGNPDLRPEESTNATLAAEWAGERLYVRAQAYRNDFDGFIETTIVGDSSGVQVYTYDNVDDGYTRGWEVEGGTRLGPWRMEGSWAAVEARRRDTGEVLLGRPEHSARASLGWAHPVGARTNATVVRTGRTGMSRADDAVVYREPFTRMDVRVSWSLPGDLDLAVGVDNVFDTMPGDWPGFARRHVYTTLRWRGEGR